MWIFQRCLFVSIVGLSTLCFMCVVCLSTFFVCVQCVVCQHFWFVSNVLCACKHFGLLSVCCISVNVSGLFTVCSSVCTCFLFVFSSCMSVKPIGLCPVIACKYWFSTLLPYFQCAYPLLLKTFSNFLYPLCL